MLCPQDNMFCNQQRQVGVHGFFNDGKNMFQHCKGAGEKGRQRKERLIECAIQISEQIPAFVLINLMIS